MTKGGVQAHLCPVREPARSMPLLPSRTSKDADPTEGPKKELQSGIPELPLPAKSPDSFSGASAQGCINAARSP